MEPQPQPKPTETKRRDLNALRPRFGDANKREKKSKTTFPRTPSQCNLWRVKVWTMGWPMISVPRDCPFHHTASHSRETADSRV